MSDFSLHSIQLSKLDKTLRHFLAAFLVLVTIAVLVGLIYVQQTSGTRGSTVVEHIAGEQQNDPLEIPEKYPKTSGELLLTTHNHLFGFSFIFLTVGFLFLFNRTIGGGWKYFLAVEPFLSVLLTFGGFWLIRYVSPHFVYLVFPAAALTYGCYFIMVAVLLYELLIQKS